ncbi:MAG: DUF4912 domain-containing protein [Bacteroides sp.]|nr:DUF4912 domain-containing protein [Prevotella sp.]MCM1407312.1 DUF4912 domain-containing protein [Treponema brennaborense]MCM1469802.1 DUF4912 domain-containing protein [Bacteroides sp.]
MRECAAVFAVFERLLDIIFNYIHYYAVMDCLHISRSYLDTLSTSDLMSLADEYSIDIPENLDRNFIIGELLEAIIDANTEKEPDLEENESGFRQISELPKTYNETQIRTVLRNPAWCYVYWDISAADMQKLVQASAALQLRILFYKEISDEKPVELFDIPVSSEDRERYVLLPASERVFNIDLYAEFQNREPSVLAATPKHIIPKGCSEISSAALEQDISPILKLSGLRELLKKQYANHRQSFL